MGKTRSYEGTAIDIHFDMSRCIHARNCYLKLPQVFDPAKKPWVSPDAAPAEEIAAMIHEPSFSFIFIYKSVGEKFVLIPACFLSFITLTTFLLPWSFIPVF